MLFPFTTVCLAGYILLARACDNRRSPLVLALAVWFCSVVGGPILFSYRVSYSLKADLLVAVCLAAMTASYLLARSEPTTAPESYPSAHIDVRLAQALGMLGVLGALLLLIDTKRSGAPLSLAFLSDNLGVIRTQHFQALERSASQSPIKVIGTYLASCSYLTVIAAIRLGNVGGLRVWAGVNFALIAAVSLLVYAGRATVFNLALLFLIGLYVCRRRIIPQKPRSLFVGGLALVAVWYFAVPWLENRESNHENRPAALLAYTQRAELRPIIASAARDSDALGLAFVSVGYFTSPLPTLSYYIQRDPLPGPLWGAYSFPLITRTATKLQGSANPNMWIESRQKVFAPLTGAGYFPNVWSTLVRDLLVDFGYIGSIAWCAALGALLALARNAYERTGQLCYCCLEVILCFSLTFGAFTSVLNNAFVSSAFIVAVAIMLANRTGLALLLFPSPIRGKQPPVTTDGARPGVSMRATGSAR